MNEVFGVGGDSLPESHLISGAFSSGIGSGGQGYNTRRPFEMAFLIDLVIAPARADAARQARTPTYVQRPVDAPCKNRPPPAARNSY